MRVAPFLLAAVAATLSAPPAAAYEATKRYTVELMDGFTVLLSPELRRHPAEATEIRGLLTAQFARLSKVIPEKALRRLRATRVWVEWDEPAPKGYVAMFYPGDRAVKASGRNPEKAAGVEIPNAARFIDAYHHGMTWVVTHELAHAYHFGVPREHDAAIQATYRQAVERKLYDNVQHASGARGRAYAVTNHKEYFATLSETYFGKSDNFPYDREGLLRYDTAGYWLMKKLWGEDS